MVDRAALEEGKEGGSEEGEAVMEGGTGLEGGVAMEKGDSLEGELVLVAGVEERRVGEGTAVGLAGSCDPTEEGPRVVGRPPLNERGRRDGDGGLLDDDGGATSDDVTRTSLPPPFTSDATS